MGVSYPAVNTTDIGAISVPLSPLPTQRAIAYFLDTKTAAIDALIAKKQQFFELLAEKRAALITAVVTGQFDSEGTA